MRLQRPTQRRCGASIAAPRNLPAQMRSRARALLTSRARQCDPTCCTFTRGALVQCKTVLARTWRRAKVPPRFDFFHFPDSSGRNLKCVAHSSSADAAMDGCFERRPSESVDEERRERRGASRGERRRGASRASTSAGRRGGASRASKTDLLELTGRAGCSCSCFPQDWICACAVASAG